MANTALTFNFSTQALRAIVIDGEPWFVAADVCEALSIANNRDAVSRLDDDERGVATTDTLGGQQEVAIINESGLYSLILTSRKPEAKKFKKWVTAEVLPAIRKTGRYVAPAQPAPQQAAERLNAHDMQNLTRVVWFCARVFTFDGAATQGIWHYLRAVLGHPAPNPWRVDQLPDLARELQRILAIANEWRDIQTATEREVIRRIFRRSHSAHLVLAEMQAAQQQHLRHLHEEMQTLPHWLARELEHLTTREPHPLGVNYGHRAEQTDFFRQSATQAHCA